MTRWMVTQIPAWALLIILIVVVAGGAVLIQALRPEPVSRR